MNGQCGPVSDRTGQTLVEIAVLLVILGTLLGRSVQPVREVRDRVSVVAAREAVVSHLFQARIEAIRSGSSRIVWDESAQRMWVERRGSTGEDDGVDRGEIFVAGLRFPDRFGVSMEVSGPSTESSLRFDAMGLGRGIGRTITVRKGQFRAQVVINGYGRARRI